MTDFGAWLRRKQGEVAQAAPLSLQTTIAALSQRLWAAETRLDQIGRLHRPDVFGVRCVHCHSSAGHGETLGLGGRLLPDERETP